MPNYTTPSLEKLLGSNYKWWYALTYNINLSLAYLFPSFFVIIRDFLPLMISLIIYGTFLESSEYLLYFFIANIFFKTCSVVWDVSWDIRNDVKNGYLSTKLLRPSSVIGQYLVITIGANFYSLIVNYILLSFILFSNKLPLWFNQNILPCLCLCFLGIWIYLSFEILIGSIVFWVNENNTIIESRAVLLGFLSGSLVLLDTTKFTNSFIFLPFSFAVYHPTQIYLGKYTQLQTLYVFLGGLAWCLVLYFLAKLVFKLGLKRYESVGL